MLNVFLRQTLNNVKMFLFSNFSCRYFLYTKIEILEFLTLYFIALEKLTEDVKKQWKKRCNVEKELVKL